MVGEMFPRWFGRAAVLGIVAGAPVIVWHVGKFIWRVVAAAIRGWQ